MLNEKYFNDLTLFKEAWIHSCMILGGISDKDFLEKKFEKFFINSNIEVYNSYSGESKNILASHLLQDIANKYILVENGVLFLKHSIFTAPCVISYKTLKKLRSYYKKNMKQAKADGDNIRANFNNLMQQNTKEALNTFYGIMINIASKFYNFDVAGSTTIRGRSTVSMNGLTIETIFGRYRPYCVSNHLHYIHNVTNKDIDWDFWKDKFISPNEDMLINHLLKEHNDSTYYGYDLLINTIRKLTDKEKCLLYYSNNFEAMVDNEYIQKIILNIMKKQNDDHEYVNEVLTSRKKDLLAKLKSTLYLDPLDGPKHLKEELNIIDRYINDILFGYYWYEGDINEYGEKLISTEYIFKKIKRDRIIITDTDSLIIYLDNDIKKIKEIKGFDTATKDFHPEMLEYVLGSFVINALSKIVDIGLKRYTEMSNIPKDQSDVISYKQEFFFETLQVTKGAKNYIGYIGIQEGVLLPHKEIEIKGLSMKKTNFNPLLSRKAKDIAMDMIAKKKKPDVKEILQRINDTRSELYDMYKGKSNIQMFTVDKYKKSYDDLYDYEKGNARVKAAKLYNALYPENQPIKFPGSFLTASVDFVNRSEEIEELYPEKYKLLLQYNGDRLLTKFKCSIRAKVRKLYSIPKEDELQEDNVVDKELLNFIYDIDAISTYEELVDKVKYLKALYKSYVVDKQPYNENIYDIITKSTISKNDIESNNKIALPLDSESVDDFITTFLATSDILVFENLASVVVEGLGLTTVRNNSNRSSISNIISYF